MAKGYWGVYKLLISTHKSQRGITLIEVTIAMMVSSLLMLVIYSLSTKAINDFAYMQAEGIAQSKVADGSFRVSRVLRSLNYIETAEDHRLVGYAYFSPNDQYTSKIEYSLSADNNKLMAYVTPMDADYPYGNLITAKAKEVVVVDGFIKLNSSPTFQYFDLINNTDSPLATPVTNTDVIKNIGIQLHAKLFTENDTKYKTSQMFVSIRNKKDNL